MKFRRLLAVALLAAAISLLWLASANAGAVTGLPEAVQSKPAGSLQDGPLPSLSRRPGHFQHPCGGMHPEPPFMGISPLSMSSVPTGGCTRAVGDPAVWQTADHSYVVLSGYLLRLFHIWNVDDPYNPVAVSTVPLPTGGTAATSIFDFKQGSNYYVSITMRGSGTGCGFFIYNVTDPANPQFVTRFQGADWCSPHEHFVSTDANGDADYAWVAMGNESGSLWKGVALDLSNLSNFQIQETGRYQRPDANSDNYVHDITVIGNRVFLAHWGGGLIIHDKETLAHNINPTPLNPIDSMRPSGFRVHHSWPTSDGNHVFVEDELLSASNAEKVKLYNITDINNPVFEMGMVGPGNSATSQAHNLKIIPQSPGRDLLLVGWYRSGLRGFEVDTTGPTTVLTHTLTHQVQQNPGPSFGGNWGVDYMPCTLNGQQRICLYSSEYVPSYGLMVNALGYDPTLDRYTAESQITDPTPGQTITTCTYLVQGNAHDYYTGVTQVEVSSDNGSTWAAAQGTTNWSYNWTIPQDGTYLLKVRARDQAGNIEAPTTAVTVTVSALCGPATATPAVTRTSTPVPTVTPCAINFSDVLPTDYFYVPVRYLFCAGAISGYSDGTFRPYANTTRGQLTKIVVLAEGWTLYTPPTPTFSDVPATHTFYQYIETAYSRAIIAGYADGTFRPGNNVTRGQLAKIIVLAEGWTLICPPVPSFTDVPIGDPFYCYIETARQRGIISGYSDGTFRPGNSATRGQISKIVYEAITSP